MSSQHVEEIVTGCGILADALEVAAGYIVAQKVEAIGTLIGMAATFIADQAASIATLGLAEAAVPVIIEAAEKLVKSLVMDLQQHIMGEVIEKAAQPLFAKVEAALSGLDWSQAGGEASESTGFSLDAATVKEHTAALRTHADTLRSHGTNFTQNLQGLSF
jgi:hypothetical protein